MIDAGGFGLLQKIAITCLMVFRNSGNTFNYAFPFLLMKQLYDCRYNTTDEFMHCSTADICAAKASNIFVEYQIDTTDHNYFENWYDQLDLLCSPTSEVMMFSSVFFFAAGTGGILLASLAERLGRKKTITIFQSISTAAQLVAIFVPNYWIRIFACALMGISNIKNGQCYTFAFELVQNSDKGFMCSAINVWDCSFLFWFNLYVLFGSKNWFYIELLFTVMGFMTLLLFIKFVPESPKWHYMNERTHFALGSF